ncbi:Serine/threonine phosphatase stp [Anatilimnocola aggregata]|uniref:Serine/threonine phosphatase stp n=1 Tax=Anatilimnocola aggregata TaxID=2528021 RepID=A0A517YM63_9BACT|nr:PP2C family serine/threonine-protein phosphatase [Anatilimnocola aggregata]QDU31317.1 Serine/threonine phosphatase stp [Anatilimnocola aggregata]
MTQNPEMHSEMKVVSTVDLDTVAPPRDNPPLAVRCFGATDKGQHRANNEDQFLVAQLAKSLRVLQTSLPQPKTRHSSDCSHLFIVADGMGGHAAGEQASALAIDSVETYILEALKWFTRDEGESDDKLLSDFRQALGHAHERVRYEAVAHPELLGMGTTLTLAYSLNEELYVAHVGDSRCYLFRDRTLYSVTQDHTLVEDMVRKGALSPEEAIHHRWRHVITSTVGGESAKVRIDVHRLHLMPGDTVLLCSDGLTEMQTGDEVAAILQSAPDPETACRELINAANAAGGRDNITTIVAQYARGEC